MIDRGFGNRVGVIADLVLVTVSVFTDVVHQDLAAVLEADRIRAGTGNGDREQSSNSDNSDT